MEVGFLKDSQYSKDKSCLWDTGSGANGYEAIADILTGAVNPSGRTPDILESDFTASPSWNDYANNFVGNEDGFDAAKGNEYTLDDGMIYKDALRTRNKTGVERGTFGAAASAYLLTLNILLIMEQKDGRP